MAIDDLADRYWELFLEANPTFATLVGDHRYNDQLEDLSDPSLEDRANSLRQLRTEVEAAATGPAGDTTNRSLLLSVIDSDLTEHDTEILVGAVDAYLGPHSGLLRAAAQTRAPSPDSAADLARRYQQVPRLLAQALERHRRHVAEGKAPTARNVERVISQVDAYLATNLSADPFVNLKLPDDWVGAETWRSDMEQTVSDVIRPAFAEYRSGLASDVLPMSRPPERSGICHITDGEATYRRLAERFVTVAYDPAEIHEIGLGHATESLADEFAGLGRRAFDTSNLPEILDRLRTDPELRYSSEREMLDHANEIVTRAWAAIDGWMGARPDGPCRVEPVPAALAPDMPPAYYMQPAPDGSRPGTYFLNTFQPETRDRFSAEAVAFHEAIPGHHFDRALAAGLTDLPAFRRMRAHNAHAEGWGLYSERLADEMGLYSGPMDRLGMLSADSWRAGRLVVDTGIHFHGWSRDRAVQFLREWTPINHPTIEQEVDRYIGWPGQALSYKMGQLEILRLRAEAQTKLGSEFDIVGFHDTVLTSGSVTLPVLADLVGKWIDSKLL